jgi:hypothetical protein
MKLSAYLLLVQMVMVLENSLAQDKIYRKNGEVIEAKVKNVSGKDIVYNPFSNPSVEYALTKDDVTKIVYENGTVENFSGDNSAHDRFRRLRPSLIFRDRDNHEVKLNYGPSILALSPLQFTENGLGLGFSYEKAIDRLGYLAFSVPLIITFNLSNGTYIDNNGVTRNSNSDAMFYLMPGIKIYPTGCYGIVKYAVGPSLVLAAGQKTDAYNSYSGYPNNNQTHSHQLLGMIINNSLNVSASEHVYLGLDFGFGFTYFNRVGGLNQGTQGLVQGGVKVGYRF